MAEVTGLRGLRYDPAVVDLGACLAPPYDVIADAEREALYARDLRNIVRVDAGRDLPDDVAGESDRHTRAREHLEAWLRLGVLRRDRQTALYVHDHTFAAVGGGRVTRRGLVGRVRALPWDRSDVLPHERTLRGPKEDRLRLMRATATQTSAVLLMWDRAPGIASMLDDATARPADVTASSPGEIDVEDHALWVVDDPAEVGAIRDTLDAARLYVADGHHRFETAAAYAAERRAADPGLGADAACAFVLAHLVAADDPALEVLPTHRLVLPGPGIPDRLEDLLVRLPGGWSVERRSSLGDAAAAAAAGDRDRRHLVAAGARDGAALLMRDRDPSAGPRDRLDVSVVQADLLVAACGLTADRIAAGALAYARRIGEAATAVEDGGAALALCVNGCSTRELIDVSDAHEQMPQKSTYFYPKVPTGLVLSPL